MYNLNYMELGHQHRDELLQEADNHRLVRALRRARRSRSEGSHGSEKHRFGWSLGTRKGNSQAA